MLDPVGTGLIQSFPRPGGNVTGITYDGGPEFVGKRLQLLREVRPSAKRVAALANLNLPGMQSYLVEYEAAARATNFRYTTLSIDRPEAVPAVLAEVRQFQPDSLLIGGGFPATPAVRRTIVDFAAEIRVPAIYSARAYVMDGGLMYYGPDFSALYARVAAIVDRILKGTRAAELPVERPTKYELVINAKTAKALGLTLPQSVVLQADEIIQ
jgi:putative ABC transport system substrate-binding protein